MLEGLDRLHASSRDPLYVPLTRTEGAGAEDFLLDPLPPDGTAFEAEMDVEVEWEWESEELLTACTFLRLPSSMPVPGSESSAPDDGRVRLRLRPLDGDPLPGPCGPSGGTLLTLSS